MSKIFFKKIVQSLTIAFLIISGAVLAESDAANREVLIVDTRGSLEFVSKTIIVGSEKITIEAPYYVNLSLLLPKKPSSYRDANQYLDAFNNAREDNYPDEEIHLTITPSASKEASGYLYIARAWAWNVSLYRNYAYGWSKNARGVISVIQTKSGTVQLQNRQGSYWYSRLNIGPGGTGFDNFNGYYNVYGGRGVCISSYCLFHIMTFYPY